MWNLPNFEKLGRFFTHGGHIMDKRVHQVRLAQWSQRIIERKNSGLTIAQWCDQNGFTKDTYHYWQKRVRAAALDAAGTTVKAPSDANSLSVQSGSSPAFAELSQTSGIITTGTAKDGNKTNISSSCAPVTIQRGSTMISITNDADSRLLTFVSEVIRNA